MKLLPDDDKQNLSVGISHVSNYLDLWIISCQIKGDLLYLLLNLHKSDFVLGRT